MHSYRRKNQHGTFNNAHQGKICFLWVYVEKYAYIYSHTDKTGVLHCLLLKHDYTSKMHRLKLMCSDMHGLSCDYSLWYQDLKEDQYDDELL